MSIQKKKQPFAVHFLAGGGAGFVEACVCHPLDTIKVRMQLRNSNPGTNAMKRGIFQTASKLIQIEGVLALYKGLGAVLAGIVPKMSIRFWSFEMYKSKISEIYGGNTTTSITFIAAGLLSGITEAYTVVTPFDVLKIRLQAQRHSLVDPLDVPKYRNAAHAAYVIIKEEGLGALYKGATLTAARQATNQAVNFTAYQEFKKWALEFQNKNELPSWQHLVLGGLSGAMGPLANAPIDTIKTRLQKQGNTAGQSGYQQIKTIIETILKKDGVKGFYFGLTPRLLRVAPGQAITFMVYEQLKNLLTGSISVNRAMNNQADQ